MRELPPIFRRASIQVLHAILMPVFFILFVLLYEPFNIVEVLDMGRELYPFNITMITCIILVSTSLMRSIFFIFKKSITVNLPTYIIYIVGEILFASFFVALYIWLMEGREHHYFYNASQATLYLYSILVYPYSALTIFLYNSYKVTSVNKNAENRIRFYDSNNTLKFVVHASDILYIEAEENYIRIFYEDMGKLSNYVIRSSMKSIEELCLKNGLIRCHRSYYINASQIKLLMKDKNGVTVAEFNNSDAKRIPVSKMYYEQLTQML